MGILYELLYVISLYFYSVHSANLLLFESIDNYTTTPLTSPLQLLNTKFNRNLKTVIYVFGFNIETNSTGNIALVKAFIEYKKHDDLNFILLDWEKEGSSRNKENLMEYGTKGIFNAKKIGQQLGDALIQLSKMMLNLDDVHLIGHSLGANLIGYAGKETISKGQYVGRITGLDPSGPLYDQPTLLNGLRKSDAIFVQVIHTDPRLYGTSENLAHVDIWINCDLEFQPGCPNKLFDTCSHIMAALYFTECVNSPEAFAAVEAKNCREWKALTDTNSRTIVHIGLDIDRNTRGIFFLRTNSISPFGKGLDGLLSH